MAKIILILASNPKDTPRLRLDEEVREIDSGLQRARKRDEFLLKQVLAARPSDVRRAMLDFKPNIVHFCGHGAGEQGIAFEDELGDTKLVRAEALADFFQLFSDRVECVVLNACYSEVQAQAIAQHINYVIGMRKEIGDKAAIEFAVAFYDALGAGEPVDFAYKLACNSIQWANVPEYLTPIMKTKSSVGKFNAATTLARRAIRPKHPLNAARLKADYQSILDLVSKSKGKIGIDQFSGDPPNVYIIRFNCRIIAAIRDNQPIWANHVTLELSLPEDYPLHPPTIQTLSPIFHPQAGMNSFCAGWNNAERGLAVLIKGLYQVAAFHNYSLTTPMDRRAAIWYRQHPEVIEELQKANSDDVTWLGENILRC